MKAKSSRVDRREFLMNSLTCAASAGLLAVAPSRLIAQSNDSLPVTKKGEIIYRELGKTGIKLPIVSMGVMNADRPEIVQAAYEAGIRHFDTAARYQYGRNEEIVGSVIKKLGARDKVIIGTKEVRPRGGSNAKETKADFLKATEETLTRLKTDYIDILYVHSVSSGDDFYNPGIMEAMDKLKRHGKIRVPAVSTHKNMAEVLKAVAENGFYEAVLTAINLAIADDTDLLRAIADAHNKGIGIIAMKTQVGGSRFPNQDALREYSSTTIATASLKWVLRNENIDTAIPGFDNHQHLKEDFSVVTDLEYTEEEEQFLSDNRITLGMGYCRQCERCLPSCPHNADIPSLMRTHMYAAQYANFHEARMALKDIPSQRGLAACLACEGCTANCANTVDIKNRIENLQLIYG